MTYKEKQEKEKEFLDSIDILPLLQEDKSLYDIMYDIEKEYGEDIFECMDIDDFIYYLNERYPDFKFYTHIDYRVL